MIIIKSVILAEKAIKKGPSLIKAQLRDAIFKSSSISNPFHPLVLQGSLSICQQLWGKTSSLYAVILIPS